jgi:isocitrate/isopropylmalate dehydrogenase
MRVPQSYTIAVLPGDGIGREVIPQAARALECTGEVHGIGLELHEFQCGGQYYAEHGEEWSEETEAFAMAEADAILLGGMGALDKGGAPVRLPDGNMAGYNVLMGLRQKLNLYANVRPVKLLEGVHTPLAGKAPEDIDMVIVRENTEGLYVPARGRVTRADRGDIAVDMRIISARGSERAARFAFELASRRNGAPSDGRRRVTCVDKSNLLVGCQLFRESFDKIGSEYADVARDYCYVDAWTLQVVRRPEFYDVVVAPNEFGDIISDLGGAIQGGLGIAPSGNIGNKRAMFEPVHGSAPDIAGKETANPIASIRSAAMMLDWLGDRFGDAALHKAARSIDRAVEGNLRDGEVRTQDLCLGHWKDVTPSSTESVGSDIIGRIAG